VLGILKDIRQTFNMPKLKNMPERIGLDYGSWTILFHLGIGVKMKNNIPLISLIISDEVQFKSI
jgi:aromatic ring-opening dioxygenase catalytic subunit (LigB family)